MMRSTLLATFAVALLMPPPVGAEEEGKLFKALGYAMFASKGADLISTEYGLKNGGYEANPLMENRGVRVATSIAAPAFINWWTARLHKENPKLATGLRIAAVVGWSYATIHNARGAWR